MDKKKIIILTSIIAVLIIGVFTFLSIRQIIKNKDLLDSDKLVLRIEQENSNKEKILLYEFEFTSDLVFEEDIYSLINTGSKNRLIIKDGVCKVVNTTCPTHSCESYIISLDGGIFANITSISCLPNGLFITLDTKSN